MSVTGFYTSKSRTRSLAYNVALGAMLAAKIILTGK